MYQMLGVRVMLVVGLFDYGSLLLLALYGVIIITTRQPKFYSNPLSNNNLIGREASFTISIHNLMIKSMN